MSASTDKMPTPLSKAISLHRAGDLESADAAYRAILAVNPGNGDALSMLISIQLQRKNPEEALRLMARSLEINPRQPDIFNNQSVLLQAMKRYDEALISHDKAIALNPNIAAFHFSRGISLQALERYDEALASYGKALALKPDYAEAYYNRATILEKMKRFDEALVNCDQAVASKPDYADAYYNRGFILQELKRYDEALVSFDKAITLKVGFAEAYNSRSAALQAMKRYDDALASCDKAIVFKTDYAEAYNNRGVILQDMRMYDEALASCDKAIALKPDFAEAYNSRSVTLQAMRRYDEALASCDEALALKPDYPDAWQNRGLILVSKGDMPGAEKAFHKALRLNPDYSKAAVSLSKIHSYQDAEHADIKTFKALLVAPDILLDEKESLCFALGKIYDDCGRYDEAFDYYRQGNEIAGADVSYFPAEVSAAIDIIIRVFSKDFLAQPFSFTPESTAPIFIVGMPRSGTTLMASILSNHPSVGTAGELPTIATFTQRPELTPFPKAVTQLAPAVATHLINEYEKRLRRDIGPDMPYIIDKHPLNFRYLGLIAMLFPKAHIIHSTRDPLDTCLSNYFQRFARDYDYSFDLRNIGHSYGEYIRLMAHWRKALPMKMLDVSYEDMVMNTEPVARRMLDFLGLEWDERCLTPHTNSYAVETASNWQVRQPIYRQSLERWRHYEKYLGPLKEMLQRSGQFAV